MIDLYNRLKNEKSSYLLQHSKNPIDWYPWGAEAFEKALTEDKPVFLSIGYSSCHWCHVMAKESFEDVEIAEILNKFFVSIKVDREERPDIDTIYMSACQSFTGSGGWPLNVFMTPDQKPFFVGTYFPKNDSIGMIGFRRILLLIAENWKTNRKKLLKQADNIIYSLSNKQEHNLKSNLKLADSATVFYEKIFDKQNGGFGKSPKFPSPHNILFLLSYYQRYNNPKCLKMAEKTLIGMYRGGMFDHIGFGFFRYSTDEKFLVPHFEKMLYDNVMLIIAYCKAYELTNKRIYLEIAEKTAFFLKNEFLSQFGGFYSSQDADVEGDEGKFYLFSQEEIVKLLGSYDGETFMSFYNFSTDGNFEGKNIPNLIIQKEYDSSLEIMRKKVYDYRKKRFELNTDKKILTFWNTLAVSAFSMLYRITSNKEYLKTALLTNEFINQNLCDNDRLFAKYDQDTNNTEGFLDDYAGYIFSQLSLYESTLEERYLNKAKTFCNTVCSNFQCESGGYYFYSHNSEKLIIRPVETYDGALPSGNSFMSYNFVKLFNLTDDIEYEELAEKQLNFMTGEAIKYPVGHAMFLTALLEFFDPPTKIMVIPKGNTDKNKLVISLPSDANILIKEPNENYTLKNNKTTYYVCDKRGCMMPTNKKPKKS